MRPDATTAVVTDTTAYLPDELIAEHGIQRVSLYVSLEGEQRPEIEIPDRNTRASTSACAAATRGRRPPSRRSATSPPSTSRCWPRAGRSSRSTSRPGSREPASRREQARQRLLDEGKGGERIHVYDSRSAAGGQGLVVLAAAHAAGRGAGGAETLAAAERCRDALEMWFAIDTLEYLRKGGRIGAAQAWLGSALQIKPILTLGEEITPVERVRTRRRAFERMVEYARQRQADGADAWVVQHIQDHETARHLVEECRDIFGSEPVFVSEVGPVLGAHVGPGMIGVGGVPSALLGIEPLSGRRPRPQPASAAPQPADRRRASPCRKRQ